MDVHACCAYMCSHMTLHSIRADCLLKTACMYVRVIVWCHNRSGASTGGSYTGYPHRRSRCLNRRRLPTPSAGLIATPTHKRTTSVENAEAPTTGGTASCAHTVPSRRDDTLDTQKHAPGSTRESKRRAVPKGWPRPDSEGSAPTPPPSCQPQRHHRCSEDPPGISRPFRSSLVSNDEPPCS